jgi:release factor glutamine methyltransferase
MEVLFHGLPLLAAPGCVMTPRSSTEAVVDRAAALVGRGPARIADVGTGSGAVAVALAVALPRARVFATDTSAAAVSLARANVARLGLGDRVSVSRGDLLEPVPGPLDLVVANLPYLPAAEAIADPDVAGEPLSAVAGPGDGLEPYRRLIEASRARLRDDGSLVIQLRRRVLVAGHGELDQLAAALSPTDDHLPLPRIGWSPAIGW